GEVIQLLGQLHSSNLLLGDMPVDTSSLLKRYKQRRQREITGQLRGILFMKIPLWDPDRFLKTFNWCCGLLFTGFGMTVWVLLALAGILYTLSNAPELSRQNDGVLSMANLPWLYLSFAITKILHEFGHGFACKRFGLKNGSDGPVHTMGLMFMMLTPVPFVDCSSAWALRSKWQRIIVGGAGMLVELMIAAIAVIIWVQSTEGSLAHSLAYNVMFVTSVSTLLFNGNPLLRYDAYYMLSDFLEIPNLASRSTSYFFYLFKKYIFGIKDSFHPAQGKREKSWLFFYSIAAYTYRIVIFVSIYLFLSEQLFAFGVIFGLGGVYRMVIKPLWDFSHYLFSSPELIRNRPRALGISFVAMSALFTFFFALPLTHHVRVEGVVEPRELHMVYALTDGYLDNSLKSGTAVKNGAILLAGSNPQLENELEKLGIKLRKLSYRYKLAQTRNVVESQVISKQIATLKYSLEKMQKKSSRLHIKAPQDGLWLHNDLDKAIGTYVQKGTELGMLVNPHDMIIRAIAPQNDAQLLDEADIDLFFRIKGRPANVYSAHIIRKFPVGQQKLPSAALGYAVGGEVQTSMSDQDGRQTAEKVFELHLEPSELSLKHIYPGQVLVMRFELQAKSLGQQTWRYLQQTFQKRFNIL
ncbi:MAG: hypothetical protein HRT88_17920, partial [Lentisphaeraceae bacterium]|nr:hypothetical protein [Lentisphaeraceae bacterium]